MAFSPEPEGCLIRNSRFAVVRKGLCKATVVPKELKVVNAMAFKRVPAAIRGIAQLISVLGEQREKNITKVSVGARINMK